MLKLQSASSLKPQPAVVHASQPPQNNDTLCPSGLKHMPSKYPAKKLEYFKEAPHVQEDMLSKVKDIRENLRSKEKLVACIALSVPDLGKGCVFAVVGRSQTAESKMFGGKIKVLGKEDTDSDESIMMEVMVCRQRH
ncbi:hypothetical protein Ancab_011222 [Ancistrocladus abbreviatus]